MNILVTGADGQLGREMRRASDGSGDNYIFTDVAQLDITDAAAVECAMAGNAVDVVVNCAAYTAVDRAEDDGATADLLNNRAVAILAAAAGRRGALLIHVSTDYVFDGSGNVPYGEDCPTAPLGVYGRTKLAGERAVVESGCRYMIFRTSWLYSPFGGNFVKTMRRLTAEHDTLSVVFDQVGTPTFAGDLAHAITGIIAARQTDRQGIYHFSNEGVCSWYDFALAVRDLAGNSCDIRPCHSDEFPSKVSRPHFSVLDKSKVKATFGIAVPHWRESLVKCMEELNGLK